MHSPAPGSQALRIGRRSIPSQVYLVTASTHERRCWFAIAALAVAASQALEDEATWRHAQALAWVLMPDHLHLLLELSGDEPLPMAISRVKSAIWHRVAHASPKQVGRLWQPSFHDHALRRQESILGVGHHLLANPVVGGLCERAQDWPWRGGTLLAALEVEMALAR